MLNFWNLEFKSRDLYRHAILLHHATFRSYNSIHSWNIIIFCLEKQTFAILELYFRFRLRPYHSIGMLFCIRLSNLIQIGPSSIFKMAAALAQFYYRFRTGWRPSLQKVNVYQQTKFHSYNSIHSWHITICGFENKRTPYWNSISSFYSDHISVHGISFCIR